MKKIIISFFLLFSLFSLAQPSSAALIEGQSLDKLKGNTFVLKEASGLTTISIGYIIATIIRIALSLLAAIFLILIIVAGFQWMTAGGNEQKVEKALARIKTAVIGLIIVLAAYAITVFLFLYLPFSGSGLVTQ
ncbi:hypothetical protein GX917_02245 [Candidatus Falkowbacteria bacterium]|jgi:hypothetical protein|nr:hypothetical protein [Candidatus Falkowbacteria bacterium]